MNRRFTPVLMAATSSCERLERALLKAFDSSATAPTMMVAATPRKAIASSSEAPACGPGRAVGTGRSVGRFMKGSFVDAVRGLLTDQAGSAGHLLLDAEHAHGQPGDHAREQRDRHAVGQLHLGRD